MRRHVPCRASRQKGVAAIELALIMLFFMGLLPVVLLFGRALFMYTMVQKSAQDAARYMATLPLQQMTNDVPATQAAAFATQLVQQALAETGPVLNASRIRIECVYIDGGYPCGSYPTRPLQVIATGGCAFLSRALGCNVLTGDGHLMAAEVGADFSGMEFSNAYGLCPAFSRVC